MAKGKVSSKTHTQQQRNHYSNQYNPNSKHYSARVNNMKSQASKASKGKK